MITIEFYVIAVLLCAIISLTLGISYHKGNDGVKETLITALFFFGLLTIGTCGGFACFNLLMLALG